MGRWILIGVVVFALGIAGTLLTLGGLWLSREGRL